MCVHNRRVTTRHRHTLRIRIPTRKAEAQTNLMRGFLIADITPDEIVGRYANVIQIVNNQYEYSLHFLCADLHTDDEELIPVVQVARIRLTEKLARELHEALGEHFSKHDTMRDIQCNQRNGGNV